MKSTDAELAYAYRDVAHAEHTLGNSSEAATYYQQAIATLDAAKEHIRSDFLANEYAGIQKQILGEYATLLRQTGDKDGADRMQKKADAIVVRTDIKPL